MVPLSRELRQGIEKAKAGAPKFFSRKKHQSTCTIKEVVAFVLVPYAGKKADYRLKIDGKWWGVFYGTNRNSRNSCKEKGEHFCPAGRNDPHRLHGDVHSEVRRLLCVNKQCGEEQALRKALRTVGEKACRKAVMHTSEFACGRCVNFIRLHPIAMLLFESINGNVPIDQAMSDYVQDLVLLASFVGVEVFHAPSAEEITPVEPAKLNIDWVRQAIELVPGEKFPEHGSRPVTDSKGRLAYLLEIHPEIKLPAG